VDGDEVVRGVVLTGEDDVDLVHDPSVTFRGGTLHRGVELFQNGLAHVSRCRGVISSASRR
jgi:hypothetical protein